MEQYNILIVEDDKERNDDMFKLMDIVNAEQPYYNIFYPTKQFTMNKIFTGLTINDSWNMNMFFEDVKPAE